jgi:hypothetical protein
MKHKQRNLKDPSQNNQVECKNLEVPLWVVETSVKEILMTKKDKEITLNNIQEVEVASLEIPAISLEELQRHKSINMLVLQPQKIFLQNFLGKLVPSIIIKPLHRKEEYLVQVRQVWKSLKENSWKKTKSKDQNREEELLDRERRQQLMLLLQQGWQSTSTRVNWGHNQVILYLFLDKIKGKVLVNICINKCLFTKIQNHTVRRKQRRIALRVLKHLATQVIRFKILIVFKLSQLLEPSLQQTSGQQVLIKVINPNPWQLLQLYLNLAELTIQINMVEQKASQTVVEIILLQLS